MTSYESHTQTAEKETETSRLTDKYSGSVGIEKTNIPLKGAGIIQRPYIEGTMGTDEESQWRPERDMIVEKPVARGALDKALLERAESIIDSFDSDDVEESVINLEALRGIVLGLWKSAKFCSYYHQDLLSTLENALLSKDDFTGEDMELFQETIRDLKREVLVENHVKIISERFIYQDFSPLAFLSEIKDEDRDK